MYAQAVSQELKLQVWDISHPSGMPIPLPLSTTSLSRCIVPSTGDTDLLCRLQKAKKKRENPTLLHLHMLVFHILCLDCNFSHEETVTRALYTAPLCGICKEEKRGPVRDAYMLIARMLAV